MSVPPIKMVVGGPLAAKVSADDDWRLDKGLAQSGAPMPLSDWRTIGALSLLREFVPNLPRNAFSPFGRPLPEANNQTRSGLQGSAENQRRDSIKDVLRGPLSSCVSLL